MDCKRKEKYVPKNIISFLPSSVTQTIKSEDDVNVFSNPLDLSTAKKSLMNNKPQMESKVKTVLKRLRVTIEKKPSDQKIIKEKKNIMMLSRRAEPVHKKVLDLKVKNVIKRLRVGIIKDLCVKDPVVLTNIKKESIDSANGSEPLTSTIKMEYEESDTLDLDIVKHEPFLENYLHKIGRNEKTLSKKNYSVVDDNHKSEFNSKPIFIAPVVEPCENDSFVINSVVNKSSEKNITKNNCDSFVNHTPSNSIDSNTADVIAQKNCIEIVSEQEKTFSKKNDFNIDSIKTEVIEKNLLNPRVIVKDLFVSAKNCTKATVTDGDICQNKQIFKNNVLRDYLLNKSSKSSDVEEKFLEQNLSNTSERYTKGSGYSDRGSNCIEKNRLIMKISRKNGEKQNQLVVEMIEKESLKKNEQDSVKNTDFLQELNMKNHKNKFLKVKSIISDLEKKSLDLIADMTNTDCVTDNNLRLQLHKINDSINMMNTSIKTTNVGCKNTSSLMEGVSNSASMLINTENTLIPSLITNSHEDNFTAEKVVQGETEFVPSDLLQTEMHQLLSCALCKAKAIVPTSMINKSNNLFVCKNCENLFDKAEIEVKLENIKNASKCNILNVTCFKCNLSFSSEKEIELHYKTHKDSIESNLLLSDGVKNFKPQVCRECNSIGNGKVGNNAVTGELCIHLRNRRHKCEYCGRLFSAKGDLKKHINIHTKEIVYECKLCKKTFACRSNLRKHLETHDKNRERQYKCEYCDKSFYKLDHLKIHVNVHTNEKLYKCPYCDKTYTRKYCLQLHVNIHTLEKLYECTFCNKVCMDRSTLRKHMALHSEESPHKCNYCDRAFKQKNQLVAHENIHTLKQLVYCDHCNKSFRNKTNLRKHIEIHMGCKEKFMCIFCNKSYSSKSNLCMHINRHTNMKSYDCTYCSKTFKDPSSLKKHVNIHTKERNYECADCGKIFNRKSHIKSHINSHMGVKPFKCPQCGKDFSQRSYLKVHVNNVHKGLKRFPCTKCNKLFKAKINLDVHVNTHTRENLFCCSYCEKEFTQKSNLKTHIFNNHSNELSEDYKL